MNKICIEIPEEFEIVFISIITVLIIYGAWKIIENVFLWLLNKY